MHQSTSPSSTDEINKKFQRLLAQNKTLENIADAQICNDIAIDLYSLRASAGLTQKALADKLGVKQSNISRWEQPGYQGYKVKVLSKIVRALGGKMELKIFRPSSSMLVYIDYAQVRLACRATLTSRHDNKKTTDVDMLEVYKEVINVNPTRRRIQV